MNLRVVGLSLVALAAVASVCCEKVPQFAGPGSSIFLQANPGFVPANGGRSVVTAFLTEAAGTPVPDGTTVLFFTDLGTVDERVVTRDGIARANFVADSRSGTATVNAWSGGGSVAPMTTTTTTKSSTGSGFAASGRAASALFSATTDGSLDASVTIDIGSALPDKVVLTANPPRLGPSRQSELTANVFDERGNPVQNVPVIFKITGGNGTETLDSGSSPRYTDSNGQAFDIIRTRAMTATTGTSVKVIASTPVEDSDPLDIPVSP